MQRRGSWGFGREEVGSLEEKKLRIWRSYKFGEEV